MTRTLATLAAFFSALVAAAAEPAVTIRVEKTQAEFYLGEDLVARYHFGRDLAKPYFWPLNAPGQVAATRGWPMVKGLPQETTDHVHQKSAWFCHGDVIPEGVTVVPSSDRRVKGVDFWSESRGHGRIVCVEATSFGEGSLKTKNEWCDSAGTKIMDEVREISLRAIAGGRLLILDIDLHAAVCPITFGDTKEGSMGVRVSDEMRLTAMNARSRMINADGKSGEKDVWGMIADWCDYSGEVGGKHVGIAVFDSPDNPAKSAWHARGYGLMAANPFGRGESGFPGRKGSSGLLKIARGERMKLRFGLFLHAGDVDSGRVAEAYAAFKSMK